jgi:glucuronokinase
VNPHERAVGAAPARAALAGNPSDGYGGAVLAVTTGHWRAEVEAVKADRLEVTPPSRLVAATASRFARELDPGALHSSLAWHTSIPRGVGLGGSSALVIATVRALSERSGVTLAPDALADFALAVETEDLGIAAGLQDRVAQAYGGLTFMDFRAGAGGRRYEPLDRDLLPELVLAWRAEAAAESDTVHQSLRERHARGEPAVVRAMSELGQAAYDARTAVMTGDHAQLAACIDRSFDLRREVLELDPRCVAMIEAARGVGAAANYTGSGGAILACARNGSAVDQVHGALRAIGCETLSA